MNLFVYRVLGLVVLLALLAVLIAERTGTSAGTRAPARAVPVFGASKPALPVSVRRPVLPDAGPGEAFVLPVVLTARADLGEILVELRPGPGLLLSDSVPLRTWSVVAGQAKSFEFRIDRTAAAASWVDVFLRSLPPEKPGLATIRLPLVFDAGALQSKPAAADPAGAASPGLRVLPAVVLSGPPSVAGRKNPR